MQILTDLQTRRIYVLSRAYLYESLQPGNTYTNVITYVVPPSLSTGRYNLTVHTDYASQVFEFDKDQNNILWREIHIEERLSDLVVSTLSTELESTLRGNIIHLNYTILNQGAGPTVGVWLDRVGISFQQRYIPSATTFFEQVVHNDALLLEQSTSQMLVIHVPRAFIGDVYVHIQVDYNGRVIEENEINNVGTDGPISLPPIFVDLNLETFSFNFNVTTAVTAGNTVALQWTVTNIGSAELVNGQWSDVVSLEDMSQDSGGSRTIKLLETQQRRSLLPFTGYEQSVDIQIPVELSGSHYLIISINDGRTIDENTVINNNIVRVPLTFSTPPTPDFIVNVVKVIYFDFDRILLVEWSVKNVGNSMKNMLLWTDQVHIHPHSIFDGRLATRVGETVISVGLLESQKEYFLSASFIIPVAIEGDYYVYIETDSGNDVVEIGGEDNNLKRSVNMISILRPPKPRLEIKISDISLPNSALAGEELQIGYTLINVGDSPLNLASWLDGIFLVSSKSVSRSEIFDRGILLTQVLNSRELAKNDQHSTLVHVTVPYGINEPLFLAVVVDVNNNLEELGVEQDGSYLLEFTQTPILIEQGPLPDLTILAASTIQILVGGQPVFVTYNVKNVGKNKAVGAWFEAIYLSEDALLDPFDTRLKTVQNLMELDEEQNYTQNVEVFIPFDIPSGNYYVFFEVDRMNRIAEFSASNNIAQQIVMITETVSTDISVTGVMANPTDLNYGDGKFHCNTRVNRVDSTSVLIMQMLPLTGG